jgi:hypothetical protein
MVSTGDTDIFGSGSFDGRNPFGSIEARKIKSGCHFGVFITVDVASVHIPFSLSGHTENAPLKKYAEFIILKFLPCSYISRSRDIHLIGDLCEG